MSTAMRRCRLRDADRSAGAVARWKARITSPPRQTILGSKATDLRPGTLARSRLRRRRRKADQAIALDPLHDARHLVLGGVRVRDPDPEDAAGRRPADHGELV